MQDYGYNNATSNPWKTYWRQILAFFAWFLLFGWLIGWFTTIIAAWFVVIGLAAYEQKSIAIPSLIAFITVALPLLLLKFMTPVEYPF